MEGLYTSDYLSKQNLITAHGHETNRSLPLTETTVPLIVWSAAEMAITLICIGIPVLRPLYKRIYSRFRTLSARSSGYLKQSDPSREQPGYALHTIGGGPLDIGQSNMNGVNSTKAISPTDKKDKFRHMEVKIGVSELSQMRVVVEDYGRSQLESSSHNKRRVLGDEEQGVMNSDDGSLNTITVTRSFSVKKS